MQSRVSVALLFDLYRELLTDKQRQILTLCLDYDLTPTEIALELGMTRQAAHDVITKCTNQLLEYESKLGVCRLRSTLMQISALIDEGRALDAKDMISTVLG